MINKVKAILHFPVDIWQMFISYLPGNIGFRLRYNFWKRRLNFLGKNVRIEVGIYFQNPQFISIDDDCWIDRNVIILAGVDQTSRKRYLIKNSKYPSERGRVFIGKRVHIAPFTIISGIGGVYISDDCGIGAGVKIYSLSHHYRSTENPSDKTIRFSPLVDHNSQFLLEGPVLLERNVGIALNAIILPGVFIGEDSFVSMNSVVIFSCQKNAIIEGNPAKRIKNRYRED